MANWSCGANVCLVFRINQRRATIKAVAAVLCVRPGKLQRLLSRSFSVASRAIRPTHRRIIKMLHAAGSALRLPSHEPRRGPSNWKRINLIVESTREINPIESCRRLLDSIYMHIYRVHARISFIVHCVARNDIDGNRRERITISVNCGKWIRGVLLLC